MKNKAVLLLLCLSLLVPTAVYADTEYSTSTASVVDTYDGINTDTDANKTTVKVTQSSSFKVSIPKTVSLDGAVGSDNKGTYTVSTEGNIASDEVIVVKPMVKSFYMKDLTNAKSDIVATVDQQVINFVCVENKDKNYNSNDTVIGMSGETGVQKASTNGVITVKKLTAGDWEGNFNFHIMLKKAIEEASTDGVEDSSSTGSTDSSSAGSTDSSSAGSTTHP